MDSHAFGGELKNIKQRKNHDFEKSDVFLDNADAFFGAIVICELQCVHRICGRCRFMRSTADG